MKGLAGVALATGLACLMLSGAHAAPPAAAAPGGAAGASQEPAGPRVDPPRNAEEYALRLFTVACITFARDPAQVVAFAKEAGMPPIKLPYATMFLDGMDGAAWSASNGFGRFVMSVRVDGSCAVHAAKADAAALRSLLLGGLINGIGEQFTVVTDGPTTVRDGPTRQTWSTGTGQKGERLQITYVAAGRGAPFAAELSARMAYTAQARPGGR